MKLIRTFCLALAIIAAGAVPSIANAQVTYTYTGKPYTIAFSPYTDSMFLAGSFTFGVAFADGTFNLAPASFSFFDGVNTYDESNSVTVGQLTVTSGTVTDWNFLLPRNDASATLSTCSYCGYAVDAPNMGAPAYSLQLGTWTVTGVPEPETYAMMLAGLGLLGFVARRRKQQAA